MFTGTTARLVALLLIAAFSPCAAVAQGPWHENFESGVSSWHDLGGNARYRVHQHQRIQGAAHTGNGCEWIRLEGNEGSFVYFAHDVGQPRICEELSPSVWVKSDRTGLQLAVQIVLPRTADPRNGRPIVTRIAGPSYTEANRWQLLRLDGMVSLLNRRLRELQMEMGAVDGREAYLDSLLLNVYGGPGVTNVWIDDLDIAGFVSVQGTGAGRSALPQPPAGAAGRGNPALGSVQPVAYPNANPVNSGNNAMVPVIANGPNAPRRHAKLVGSTLLIDGPDSRPMFPRIVQHRGEPLKKLQEIGFNGVWMEHAPAPEVFEEATRLGLWLVCPPPRPTSNDQGNERSANGLLAPPPMIDFGPTFDAVLAWNLGTDLTSADLESTRRWATQVQGADRRVSRPLICRTTSNLRGFSRLADLLLLIDRRPLGASLDLVDYGEWVCRQPQLARPGTSVWTTIQTQPAESLRQQLALIEPNTPPPLSVPPEQIRLLVYTAIASGSRGLLFLSDTPLDALDPETRLRALTLELLNLEIALMEPWAAASESRTAAKSESREVNCTVLKRGRAHLLLPIWSSPGSQCVPPQAAVKNLLLTAPGIPETSDFFAITPGGIQELPHQRPPGGMQVTIKEFDLTAQVLATNDPEAIRQVQQLATKIGKRAADLQRQLAAMKWSKVQATVHAIGPRRPARPIAARFAAGNSEDRQMAAWITAAGNSVRSADTQFAAGDLAGATRSAQYTCRALRMVERAHWDAAVQDLQSPVTMPTSLYFDTLPQHWRWMARIRSSLRGANILPGGDFENPEGVRLAWRAIQPPTPGVLSAADFTSDSAHSGRFGLRLAAQAEDPENPPVVVEMAPIMYSTPPVAVEAGQIICIHGWVNVPRSITGNVDGLLILDSLTTDALANRIQRTNGWKEFAMYRVAAQPGTMSVIFALSGLGEAQIDDVAIEVLQGPMSQPLR